MWAVWLGIFVLALIIEAIGTDLVSIWFALGSIIALVISFIPGVSWWIELIVFVVISMASLMALRPFVHKYMRRGIVNSNIDEIIHQKGVLTKKVDLLHHGEVELHGVKWTVIGESEKDSIKEGSLVEVLAVSGNKLVVREIKDNSPKEGN